MRLLRCFCTLAFITSWLYWLPELNAQALGLDAILQDYAFRSIVRSRTGILQEGTVPANLTGIKIAAMRLKNGSLRKRGVPTLKEFAIPKGLTVKPYVTRLVLVYQNLGNLSQEYYPLPGYTYAAPVLGLLAYDAKNLSATNLQELDIRVSGDPIRIVFTGLKRLPEGSIARCVTFDLKGLVIISDTIELGNTCTAVQQGHYSIVVKSTQSQKIDSKAWVIAGSVIGGLVLLLCLTFLVWRMRKHKEEKRIGEMEQIADAGETLRMKLVMETRAPVASTTRTLPILETD